MLASDPAPSVRRECAEVAGRISETPIAALEDALSDPSPEVREAAANALGEIAEPDSVEKLIALAADAEEDRLVREAAVASLGAIGDERARPILLALIASAPPQIRRRCVPALSVFDGSDIEAALQAAARDRNPMVREAAEMVVGRQRD
jgi:HEAT repeat protein